jgi:hypothetical protein
MRLILIGLLWRSSETISSIYQSTRRDILKDWKVRIFFCMDLREIIGEKRSWWNERLAGLVLTYWFWNLGFCCQKLAMFAYSRVHFYMMVVKQLKLSYLNTSLCKRLATRSEELKFYILINDKLRREYLKPHKKG